MIGLFLIYLKLGLLWGYNFFVIIVVLDCGYLKVIVLDVIFLLIVFVMIVLLLYLDKLLGGCLVFYCVLFGNLNICCV